MGNTAVRIVVVPVEYFRGVRDGGGREEFDRLSKLKLTEELLVHPKAGRPLEDVRWAITSAMYGFPNCAFVDWADEEADIVLLVGLPESTWNSRQDAPDPLGELTVRVSRA